MLSNIQQFYTYKQIANGFAVYYKVIKPANRFYRLDRVAIYDDAHLAERHAHLLNTDNFTNTLGYIIEDIDGEATVMSMSHHELLDTIIGAPIATFKDYAEAKDYAIGRNTELLFQLYENENRAKMA